MYLKSFEKKNRQEGDKKLIIISIVCKTNLFKYIWEMERRERERMPMYIMYVRSIGCCTVQRWKR